MKFVRFVEYQHLFSGVPEPLPAYLAGNDRAKLLRTATFFLGRYSAGISGYWDDLHIVFCRENWAHRDSLVQRVKALAEESKTDSRVTHPRVSLQLFSEAFQLPDAPAPKNAAQFERDIVKSYAALNSRFVQQQDVSMNMAKAKPELQGVPELAVLTLAGAHADFDIVYQENPGLLMMSQILKAIKLFQFLEASAELHPLLTKFLNYYDCHTWQEYLHSWLPAVMPVIRSEKPGHTQVIVPPEAADYEQSCAFLDKFTLHPGEALTEGDFLSLRAKAFYKVGPGDYEIIYAPFLIETIYKGLYFKLSELNNSAKPKVLGSLDFRGAYCNLFSEQCLLNTLLDELFSKGGVKFSGSEILAGHYFQGDGDSEPDYYHRSGRNTLLVESKDVLLRKEVKVGDDFGLYIDEVRKKFYYDHDRKGRLEKKAVLQLIGNVRRVLTTGMSFDPGCRVEDAVVHPLLVVHDRQFNLPGLNALVATWFQQELDKLQAEGLPVQRVRPLVVLDVDTLISLREPLRRRRLVLFDELEAYHRYLRPRNKAAKSEEELRELVFRQCQPFSLFLQNRAKAKGLSFHPRRSMDDIAQALGLKKGA